MAEFIEFLPQEGFRDDLELNFPMPEELEIELTADGIHNFPEILTILREQENSVLQEMLKLLKIAHELQQIMARLDKTLVKLIDIKLKDITKNKQKDVNIFSKQFEYSKDIFVVQQMVNVLHELGISLNTTATDEEKIVQRAYRDILKFQEEYKKCVFFLENLIHSEQNEFEISNFPRHCHEYIGIILSTYKENIASYRINLALSKKKFDKFESVIRTDVVSCKEFDCKISRYRTAIIMASEAWSGLFPILCNILDIDD